MACSEDLAASMMIYTTTAEAADVNKPIEHGGANNSLHHSINPPAPFHSAIDPLKLPRCCGVGVAYSKRGSSLAAKLEEPLGPERVRPTPLLPVMLVLSE